MIKYVLERIYFLQLVYSFLIPGRVYSSKLLPAITKFEMIDQYLLVCGCFLWKMILCIELHKSTTAQRHYCHLQIVRVLKLNYISVVLSKKCLCVILKLLLDPGSIKKLIRRDLWFHWVQLVSDWRVWVMFLKTHTECLHQTIVLCMVLCMQHRKTHR